MREEKITQQEFSLKLICLQAVRKHLAALGIKAVLGKREIFSYLRFNVNLLALREHE